MNIESLPEKKQGCPAERERRRRNMGGKFNMQRGRRGELSFQTALFFGDLES